MSRAERWWVHLSNLAVGGTGMVYAVMLYVLENDDPFSIVNHPWQPHVQHMHVLTAPFFVFAVGLIWRRHIWGHWSRKASSSRRSGSSLLLLLVPMVLSGYLLQTAVEPDWRKVWETLHVGTSCLWIVFFTGHFLSARRLGSKISKSKALDR